MKKPTCANCLKQVEEVFDLYCGDCVAKKQGIEDIAHRGLYWAGHEGSDVADVIGGRKDV